MRPKEREGQGKRAQWNRRLPLLVILTGSMDSSITTRTSCSTGGNQETNGCDAPNWILWTNFICVHFSSIEIHHMGCLQRQKKTFNWMHECSSGLRVWSGSNSIDLFIIFSINVTSDENVCGAFFHTIFNFIANMASNVCLTWRWSALRPVVCRGCVFASCWVFCSRFGVYLWQQVEASGKLKQSNENMCCMCKMHQNDFIVEKTLEDMLVFFFCISLSSLA